MPGPTTTLRAVYEKKQGLDLSPIRVRVQRRLGQDAGNMFDEIAEVVRPTGAKFTVRQLKEKYGTLHLYGTLPLSGDAKTKVNETIASAEVRGGYVCDQCGAAGKMRETRGWYATRCDAHADASQGSLGKMTIPTNARTQRDASASNTTPAPTRS